jgi:hypothetical protein
MSQLHAVAAEEASYSTSSDEDATDNWVCCDRCGKWRRIAHVVTAKLRADEKW